MIFSTVLKLSLGLCSLLSSLGVVAATVIRDDLPSLLDATLDELRHGLDAGLFTSVDLTKAYIARINEVADQLHAVNEINPDALSIAADMDARRNNKTHYGHGPLYGIPVLIKDTIATLDKMNNTAGSFALVGARPKEDSTIAAKLRKAGVIILGKANLSQWASFRSYNSSNGWSAYGGQTKGAFLPDQDPSGSSSGSGVSSSIGLAWATLGTETAGSLTAPCNANNIVGIKPSVGLTSRHLVFPLSEHHDTVGPMARTVKDAAYLLAAIAGVDKNDNYTSAIPFKGELPDYVASCKEDGLKGKRIGVARGLSPLRQSWFPVMQAFDDALAIIQSENATIIEDIAMPGDENVPELSRTVLGANMLTNVASHYFNHLQTNPHNITTLKQLQDFTQKLPEEEWPVRDTRHWQNAIDKGINNTSPEFWRMYTEQLYFAGPQGILGALRNNSLDALVFPTALLSPLPDIAGSPIITVPLGKQPDWWPERKNGFGNLNADGPNMPFGLAFAGDLFCEEKLIEIAYAFERKTKFRSTVQPIVKPKTELRDIVGNKG